MKNSNEGRDLFWEFYEYSCVVDGAQNGCLIRRALHSITSLFYPRIGTWIAYG